MTTFSCDQCDHAPFPTESGLKMHKVRKHTKHAKGAYKRKKQAAGDAPNETTKRKYTKRVPEVSLEDAIAALKVRRDALTETILILEVMQRNAKR